MEKDLQNLYIEMYTDSPHEYEEIEFVCVNPEYDGATDEDSQMALYQELSKLSNVITLFQDWGDGQKSLTAIYNNPNVKTQILEISKKYGIKVDMIDPVSDDYVNRAIRGEHEGQIH
jgi:hypothetical protein|tara:strand:+ start:177 stop:527 length:351 start_codon:yes stop_codon:yes gene_type:complete